MTSLRTLITTVAGTGRKRGQNVKSSCRLYSAISLLYQNKSILGSAQTLRYTQIQILPSNPCSPLLHSTHKLRSGFTKTQQAALHSSSSNRNLMKSCWRFYWVLSQLFAAFDFHNTANLKLIAWANRSCISRMLPAPLMTYQYHRSFIKAASEYFTSHLPMKCSLLMFKIIVTQIDFQFRKKKKKRRMIVFD